MIEQYLFSGGAGIGLGFLAGFAIKRILKIAAIILGVFILGLAYLSYKGWLNVNWSAVQNQTESGLHNATQQAAQYIQHMTTQLSQHPAFSQASGQGMTITAGVMFPIGFVIGLRH